MTHEELLDCIDKFDAAVIIGQPAIKALRSVVELHKPDTEGYCNECTLKCWGCEEWGCGDDCDCQCHPMYPCPTIQAIEKELI